MIATLALQQAIFTTLTADTDLMVRVTGVFDALPDNTAFPYVVIGEDTEIPWNTLTRIGRECTITLHIFSRYPGMKECKEIADRITDLIERKPLSANSRSAVTSVLDMCQFFTDPDGITRHGVVRVRFKVS